MERTPAATGKERGLRKLLPLQAKTLVDQVVDAIVEATATGVFLPGDRVVEAEVARSLNVSRVPVREALRILESQGIVINERYRGMRLMNVSPGRLEETLKVRLALETLAMQEVLAAIGKDPSVLAPLEDVVERLHAAVRRKDSYGVAQLDTDFHRTLCRLSGNDVLLHMWEPLSRQLTIIFGISLFEKEPEAIAAEHDELLAGLKAGNDERVLELLKAHILDYTRVIDYEALVSARKKTARKRGKADGSAAPRATAQEAS